MLSRIIPRLEVKSRKLIKGIRMEGLRVVGDPLEKIIEYYEDGADEIIYDDIVASLYGREFDLGYIKELAKNIYIPFCVGGGIKSINDIHNLLNIGADKVALNTNAIKNPELIYQAARIFGSQCIVTEIQAKNQKDFEWEAFTESGRERHKLNAIEWAKRAQELGSGEILLLSVDNDGMRIGLDLELIKSIRSCVSVPVIAGGGIGSISDVAKTISYANADAVTISHCLHFGLFTLKSLKYQLNKDLGLIRM